MSGPEGESGVDTAPGAHDEAEDVAEEHTGIEEEGPSVEPALQERRTRHRCHDGGPDRDHPNRSGQGTNVTSVRDPISR